MLKSSTKKDNYYIQLICLGYSKDTAKITNNFIHKIIFHKFFRFFQIQSIEILDGFKHKQNIKRVFKQLNKLTASIIAVECTLLAKSQPIFSHQHMFKVYFFSYLISFQSYFNIFLIIRLQLKSSD